MDHPFLIRKKIIKNIKTKKKKKKLNNISTNNIIYYMHLK